MTTSSSSRTAFFYGTLMSPEVLYRVIYGTISPDPWQKERLSTETGHLHGYQRHRVKYADYPAISPVKMNSGNAASSDQTVLGTIVKGLSDMDIMRLDVFEGDQYDRKVVSVRSHDADANEIQAETYVWKDEYAGELDPEEWDFEEFRREKLQYWAGPEVMRDDYEEVDAAVANLAANHDGTGGRGANGDITKKLTDLAGAKAEEPLKSAV